MFQHSTPITSNHESINQDDHHYNIAKGSTSKGVAPQTSDDLGKLHITECDNATVATVGTSVSYSTYGTTFSGQTVDTASCSFDHLQFWKRSDLRIHAMPTFYLTEQDVATFLKQDLKEVTSRLLDVFSSLSLMVSYDRGDELTTASAACRCMDGVGFHVLIWEKNAREYQLEIRHTSGCGTRFRQKHFCDAILSAVSVKNETDEEAAAISSAQADPLDFDFMEEEEEVRLLDSVWRRCRGPISPELEQLFMALDTLLTSPRLDAIVEGFTMLLDATHPQTAGFRVATAVATALLTSSSSKCSSIVLSLAFAETWPAFVEMRPSDLRLHESLLAEYSHQAWKVVAQSVSFLDTDGLAQFVEHANAMIQMHDSGESSLEEVLLRTVHTAREQPHLAYCATHILSRLSALPNATATPAPSPTTVPHFGLQRATQRWAATVESR